MKAELLALAAKWESEWPDYAPDRFDEYDPANRAAHAVMGCVRELRALAAQPAKVADGFVVVPVEAVKASEILIERLRRDMQKINDDCDGEEHLNVSSDALDAIGAYRNNVAAMLAATHQPKEPSDG